MARFWTTMITGTIREIAAPNLLGSATRVAVWLPVGDHDASFHSLHDMMPLLPIACSRKQEIESIEL
jgi:hypothetical protein